MPNRIQRFLLIILVTGLAACQDSGSGETELAAAAELADVARFSREMRKNGCELLTPGQVSAAFSVPADALRQMKILGCRYSWEGDEETLEAGISMIRAHKSEKSAAGWFATATASKTAEEMQAEMEKISAQLESREELDTGLKKSTAKNLLATVGSKAVNFEDVADVGDEARMNDEGTVFVRVDNLTFMVSAYKGTKAPPMDLVGVDLNKMASVAQRHAEQWAVETAPQRRKDGVQLARIIAREI